MPSCDACFANRKEIPANCYATICGFEGLANTPLSLTEPGNVFRGDFAGAIDAEAIAVALQLTFR